LASRRHNGDRDFPGFFYVIHFEKPLAHARHYTGWAEDLQARMADHFGHSNQAKLIRAVQRAGISYRLAAYWSPLTLHQERLIKRRKCTPRFCPACRPDLLEVNSGEKALIRVRGVSPLDGSVITDATGTAYLYAPPKNPSVNPGDRIPDVTVALTFDPAVNYYLGTWDSTGAAAGNWWCQGVVAGGAAGVNAWAYQDFPVDA
jgi:predicted GIY-YIG superfamily endonuclease